MTVNNNSNDKIINKIKSGENMEKELLNSEPSFKEAARMIVLSKKPFLSLDELAEYLDLSAEETKNFIERHKIAKIFLTDNAENWVVRRVDVDYLIEEADENSSNNSNE